MDQLVIQRLTDVENQLFEIHNLHQEEKKWRTILNHWIKRNFDFDVEKQMEQDLLSFCCEPPSVGNLIGKNVHMVPHLEPILRKHQLEIAEYIKKINHRVHNQSQMVQQNSIPNRIGTGTTSQPQAIYQTQHTNVNLIPQMNKNQTSCIQYDHPQQSQQQHFTRQRTHHSVQNQQLLQKQRQQQRELAWLQQISRPGHMPTGPGPGQCSDRSSGWKNPSQNLGHNNNNSLRTQRNNSLTLEAAVGTTRSIQLQRLPVTIEKINAPAPVSMSSVERDSSFVPQTYYNNSQTGSSERRLPPLMTAPTRKVAPSTLSSSSGPNFQDFMDDLGRLCTSGSVQQQQHYQQRQNNLQSQKPSVPSFVYECQTCGMKFRLKSAAQLHIAKVHPVKQKQPHDDTSVHCSKCSKRFRDAGQLQIHENICQGSSMAVTGELVDAENPMPIIMSVAGGGKRYVRKEQTRTVSIPAGLSISINPVPAPSSNSCSSTTSSFSSVKNTTVQGNNRVLDEITISDDEDQVENQEQQSGMVSISLQPVQPQPVVSQVGNQPQIPSELYSEPNDDIICESHLQRNAISNIQNNSSASSSASTSKTSKYILSSTSTSLLDGQQKVGDKRRVSSLSTEDRDLESSCDKRNRTNDDESQSTAFMHQDTSIDEALSVPVENLEVVPEINLYTDNEYQYESHTDINAPDDFTINDSQDVFHPNNSTDCEDLPDDHFNDANSSSSRRPSSQSIEIDSVATDNRV